MGFFFYFRCKPQGTVFKDQTREVVAKTLQREGVLSLTTGEGNVVKELPREPCVVKMSLETATFVGLNRLIS